MNFVESEEKRTVTSDESFIRYAFCIRSTDIKSKQSTCGPAVSDLSHAARNFSNAHDVVLCHDCSERLMTESVRRGAGVLNADQRCAVSRNSWPLTTQRQQVVR